MEAVRGQGVPVRVLIADDHPPVRVGLGLAIHEHPELELVAECADGESAAGAIAKLSPNVAVLDFELPDKSGLEVIRSLGEHPTRILFLSAHTDGALVHAAVSAGAVGYLDKTNGGLAICDAILAAARGEEVFCTKTRDALTRYLRVSGGATPPHLTPQELRLLTLLADDGSLATIAVRLNLSPNTLKTHAGHLYRKLGVSNRASAIAKALREGLIE